MAREDRGRIRVVVIDVEGNNGTLQDALRTAANALQRPQLPGRVKPAALPSPKGKGSSGSGRANDDAQDDDAPLFDPVDVQQDDDEEVIDAPVVKKAKANKDAPPKLIEVDLNGGDVPFRTFVEQKRAEDHFDRYLVLAFWFKTYRNTDTITPDHAYTCYRFLDGAWQMPKNWGQTFRDMKKKDLFDNGESRRSWKITHIGEDRVMRMGATTG